MQVFGEGYYIGTTENPIGVFAIIHNLFGIVKWGQGVFRDWFKRELLGENWRIVP
jgi:hypothetical protein